MLGDEDHYRIDYHIFAFTQLLYSIKERLGREHPSSLQEIEKFFSNPTTLNAAIIEVANGLKHLGAELIHVSSINLQLDIESGNTKVVGGKTDRRIKSKDPRIDGKNLSEVIEKAYLELEGFLEAKKINFVYGRRMSQRRIKIEPRSKKFTKSNSAPAGRTGVNE